MKQWIFLISWSNWIICTHSYAALCQVEEAVTLLRLQPEWAEYAEAVQSPVVNC